MRGVAPLSLLVVALALAAPASASHSSLSADAVVQEASRSSLDEARAFDLFLLPDTVLRHLGLGPWDLGPTAETVLPGPNDALEPRLALLLRQADTIGLPDLPSLDGALTSPNPATGGASVAPTDFDHDVTPATDGDDADAPRSPGAFTTTADAFDGSSGTRTADASASRSASASSSGVTARWNELDPAAKVAIGAGLLGLLLFAPFAMYSRIQRDDALQNKTRRAVYEVVEANPGLCIKDVAQRTKVSYSTASYHLDRLVRTGFLVPSEQGNRVLYYKNGGEFSKDEREIVPILKNDECMRVFNHILENPWCYRAEVAQALNVSHTTINWHLKRLVEASLVEEHREGRNCHLYIDKPALDRILDVLDKMEAAGTREMEPMVETPVVA